VRKYIWWLGCVTILILALFRATSVAILEPGAYEALENHATVAMFISIGRSR